MTIVSGKGHRFVVVLHGKAKGLGEGVNDTDPHMTEKPISKAESQTGTPESKRTAAAINALYGRALPLLKARAPANAFLLRGIAVKPPIPTLSEKFGLKSAVIATYPMYKGLAQLVGMVKENPPGEGVRDLFSTFRRLREQYDFFFIHVKLTDQGGEDGDMDLKVQTIEEVNAGTPRTPRGPAPCARRHLGPLDAGEHEAPLVAPRARDDPFGGLRAGREAAVHGARGARRQPGNLSGAVPDAAPDGERPQVRQVRGLAENEGGGPCRRLRSLFGERPRRLLDGAGERRGPRREFGPKRRGGLRLHVGLERIACARRRRGEKARGDPEIDGDRTTDRKAARQGERRLCRFHHLERDLARAPQGSRDRGVAFGAGRELARGRELAESLAVEAAQEEEPRREILESGWGRRRALRDDPLDEGEQARRESADIGGDGTAANAARGVGDALDIRGEREALGETIIEDVPRSE